MTHPDRHIAIVCAPRSWLLRAPGECAFPVEGEGAATRACCNPSGEALYCTAHAKVMRRAAVTSAEDYEREVIRFLEQRR